MSTRPTHVHDIQHGSLRWLTPPDAPTGTKLIQAKTKHSPDADWNDFIIIENRDLGPTHSWARIIAGDYGAVAAYDYPPSQPDEHGHLVIAASGAIGDAAHSNAGPIALTKLTFTPTSHLPSEWQVDACPAHVVRLGLTRPDIAPQGSVPAPAHLRWARSIYAEAYIAAAAGESVIDEVHHAWGQETRIDADANRLHIARDKHLIVLTDKHVYGTGDDAHIRRRVHFLLPPDTAIPTGLRLRVGVAS